VISEADTTNAAKVYIICSVLWVVLKARRRRVIVFDDAMKAIPNLKCYTHDKQREALDSLRQIGQTHPLIIISSNEGINACFPDEASELHTAVTFPFAQYEEFVVAIKDCTYPRFKEIIHALDVKGLENIITLFPKRYALSIHWWSCVQFHPVESAPQWSPEKRIGADFLLKFLREVLHALLPLLSLNMFCILLFRFWRRRPKNNNPFSTRKRLLCCVRFFAKSCWSLTSRAQKISERKPWRFLLRWKKLIV
jgi:hypothetical protein